MTEAYRTTYKMRIVGDEGIEVTLPKIVIEREARKYGLTLQEFVKKFRAVAHFNGIEGVLYRFELAENHSPSSPPVAGSPATQAPGLVIPPTEPGAES